MIPPTGSFVQRFVHLVLVEYVFPCADVRDHLARGGDELVQTGLQFRVVRIAVPNLVEKQLDLCDIHVAKPVLFADFQDRPRFTGADESRVAKRPE
jgi:hypothetical protein